MRIPIVLTTSLLIPALGYSGTPVNTWTVVAVTDRHYHGITETRNRNAVWVTTELTDDIWFGGITLGFAPHTDTIERHRPLEIYIGAETQVVPGWRFSTALRYRSFVNSNKEWDYPEVSLQLRDESGWSFTLDYADNYYAHDTTALVSEIGRLTELNKRLYLRGKVGHAQLDSAEDYAFWQLSTGWRHQKTVLELSYHRHNLGGNIRFRDPVQASGFEIKVSHRLR